MNWFPKKKRPSTMQLEEVEKQVERLESKPDALAKSLLTVVDDPWARDVLKSIYLG